jgi:hypothetical protein
MKSLCSRIIAFIFFSGLVLTAVAAPEPIIDVHFHTFTGNAFPERMDDGVVRRLGTVTREEALAEGLEVVRKYDIYAITGGPPERVDEWVAADPERFIPAMSFGRPRTDRAFLDMIRDRARAGKLQAIGEVALQYAGVAADDPAYDVYFSLAVELDVPIGVHLGPGPMQVRERECCPNYRVRAGDPLLLEEVLVRYPDLRIFVMHAGWPFLDNMIAILNTYKNVYVELSDLATEHRVSEYHRYLKALVDAGFSDRIMFGSDPHENDITRIVTSAIDRLNAADFLTPDQKRDIFFNNAARFFRLEIK